MAQEEKDEQLFVRQKQQFLNVEVEEIVKSL
jgi:hypothetical protein